MRHVKGRGAHPAVQTGDFQSHFHPQRSVEDTARAWLDAGARRLHLVDLNGAFEGRSVNGSAVDAILAVVGDDVRVQLGGGIRSLDAVEGWLARGLSRVILGTVAVRRPDLVREAARLFPGRIAVGIDARGGKVAVEGWAEASELEVTTLARAFEDAGVSAIIYTDIDRDGILAVTTVPAPGVDAARQQQAAEAAKRIAASLDYVGVLCVEFFVLADGTLVANEMAPRPHNSGHYTVDACDASQFDLQVRTLAGLPLPPPRQHSAAIMLNLLGYLWFDAAGAPRPLPGGRLIGRLP